MSSNAAKTMMLSFQFRLRPTWRQHQRLAKILEQQRQLYNAALQERISAFERGFYPDEVPGKVNYYQNALIKSANSNFAKAMKEAEEAKLGEIEREKVYREAKAIQQQALAAVPASVAAYRKTRQHKITLEDQSRSLTIIRDDDPAFAEVQRRIQKETLYRLDLAYKAFFRRVGEGFEAPGFPRFRSRDFFDGFGFDAYSQVKLIGRRLSFSGMRGGIRVLLDRSIKGEIKNIWFKREDRRWFVGFQIEVEVAPPRATGKTIGVDWGTSDLAVLSSGETIPNPRFRETLAAELRVWERKVARAKRGSKNRMRARRRKQKIERKIANRRRDYLDKVSKRLVNHFRVVAVEKLSVKRMVSKPDPALPRHVTRRRNRELHDAAPAMMRKMIEYKAVRDGGTVVTVDPKNTTQECSACGDISEHSLGDMWHHCVKCGCSMPRKKNSALVILKRAQNGVGPTPVGAKLDNGLVCPETTKGAKQPAFGRRGRHPLHPSLGKLRGGTDSSG